MDFVSLLTTATASCNHTSTSAGGSGCTVLRLTPTSLKESSVKVKHFAPLAYPVSVFIVVVYFSGRALWDHLRGRRIRICQSTWRSIMPTVPGPVHQPVWRLHHESRLSEQLPVLFIQDHGPVLGVQFEYLL
jgi:hypothetical protein